MNEKIINELVERINELSEKLEKRQSATKEFLTTEEAACYLGCSAANIYKLTMNREIPHFKPSGKMMYFKRGDLDAWITRCRVSSQYEIRRMAENR